MIKEKNANLEPLFKWLTLIWEKISGVGEYVGHYIPILSLYLVIITILSFLAEMFGIVFECKTLVFVPNVILITCLLFGNFATKELASLLIGISEINSKTEEEVKKIVENIKQLFNPLQFITTIFSFLSAWIMMNGFGAFNATYFYVTMAVIMFLSLTFRKSNLPTVIMTILVFGSLFFWYTDNCGDPLAANLHSKAEIIRHWSKNNSLSDEASTAKMQGVVKETVKVVYKNAVVQNGRIESADENTDSASLPEKGSVVQIISIKPLMYDEEKLIEVRMANIHGGFINGVKVWMQPELLEIGNNIVSYPGYTLVKTGSGNMLFKKPIVWKIYFQTSKEISLVTTELQGKNILISGFERDSLKWNDPGTGELVSYGSPYTPVEHWKRGATIFKLKKGEVIEIFVTEDKT